MALQARKVERLNKVKTSLEGKKCTQVLRVENGIQLHFEDSTVLTIRKKLTGDGEGDSWWYTIVDLSGVGSINLID